MDHRALRGKPYSEESQGDRGHIRGLALDIRGLERACTGDFKVTGDEEMPARERHCCLPSYSPSQELSSTKGLPGISLQPRALM